MRYTALNAFPEAVAMRREIARQESRGMHRRDDFPDQDDRQRHYITSGGLDEVWTSARPHAEAVYAEAAE